MVANFRKAKDHHSLMFAMPEVIKRFPNVRLNLVGHDYGTFDEIQELAKTLEISKHVDFITDCTQPEPIIGRSQIGILSTHGEGLSNSLLEYMALSKPVIVSNNGGNPEVVIDNTTGFLVPPGSSDAINEKLLFLLDNPEIARIMGEKGRSRVEDQFSNEKMVKDYINLYKEMIASE
jgi:glycosyltransferase involved in cell wall biosynthesis